MMEIIDDEVFAISDLLDPDDVGAAEYRIIYELLDDQQRNNYDSPFTKTRAITICEEIRDHANAIINRLKEPKS